MGIYVYAIGRAEAVGLPELAGIMDHPAYCLPAAGLAAMVSDCPAAAVRPERKHIAASQRVMSALNARFDLLPMAFGTIAESAEALVDFLEQHRERLIAQLDRVAGKLEMDLRLSLDVADPIAFLVETTPALKAARDRTFGRRRSPSADERMRIGQLCEEALRRYRETQTASLRDMLAASCAEIIALPTAGDSEIAHLAVLVARGGGDRFDAVVSEAAARLPDVLAVTIGGPWPPHNFVQPGL